MGSETSYKRDPVSELLDDGARQLLERVYAAPRGQWVPTRLADPGAGLRAWAASAGIDLMGPDNAPTVSGRRQDAHTRYGRAFARALFYNHKWYGGPAGLRRRRRMVPYDRPLELEWGRRMRALGIIPAGRAVRIRIRPGGKTARAAVARLSYADRIYAGNGERAGRASVAEERDWRLWQRPTASYSYCYGRSCATCGTQSRRSNVTTAPSMRPPGATPRVTGAG